MDVDIPGVCSALLKEHDANQDGFLSEEELGSVPPLDSRYRKMESSGDGRVSQEELQAHFEKVFDPTIGMLGATCMVTNKGRPLGGAIVHLIPPDYLQLDRSVMPIASGMTTPKGLAEMEIHPDYLPAGVPKLRGLVRPGFYLVEVTKEGVDIPARYNTETTLGVEVSAETNISGPLNVRLDF